MIRIAAPDCYDRRQGVLATIADHVLDLGERAFILGGRTALDVALPAIAASLGAKGVWYEVQTFSGQPTVEAIEQIAARLQRISGAVVIGVGGGKALDAAKAAGALSRRQIITVPTVAATCAAWAALSIIYSEAGVQEEARSLSYGPRRILVEPDILARAPARFLAAGVADTVVKWFETAPNLTDRTDPLALRLQASFGAFTLETLERALDETGSGAQLWSNPAALGDAFDAVIGLAGLCGSVKGDRLWGGLAHPFYVAATHEPETRTTLHGAIVGFGLLVQLALEGKPAHEINVWVDRWAQLGLPIRLADLGLSTDVEAKIQRIAARVAALAAKTPFAEIADEAAIAKAIRAVDALGLAARQARAA